MLMSGRTLYRVYDDLDGVETFPEVLDRNGYVTFGTGKWHQSRQSFARSFQKGRRVFFGGVSDTPSGTSTPVSAAMVGKRS
jgi:arylsulfatase A-like enzyme